MKKILITGCAGFIGYHLSKKLSSSYKIIGIDNLNEYYDLKLKKDRLKQLLKIITFYNIDICSTQFLTDFFKNIDIDCVIHLAAQAGVRYSFEKPESYITNNIFGTFNLLENIKNRNIPIIFASSSSVYGNNLKKKSFNENSNSDHPMSLYAASKKSCEAIIHNYSENYNITSIILRFFTVYGPWGRPDMALFNFIKQILNDEPIKIYNNGELWRDFTYIDDLTETVVRLIELLKKNKFNEPNHDLEISAPYYLFNIGNQNATNLLNFIKIIEKIVGKKSIKKMLSKQAGDVHYTLANTKLIKDTIDYAPNTPLELGVKNFYDWYIDYYINKKYD